jgi:hypothetical protein
MTTLFHARYARVTVRLTSIHIPPKICEQLFQGMEDVFFSPRDRDFPEKIRALNS